MLRIGIIGCGKIADAHAEQIQRIPGCEIVGACDREELMARQFCERFQSGQFYSDVNRFLDEAGPHVVHITTPPRGHFGLARTCLEAGCHVYVEKPFTVDTAEAEELIRIATARGLKVTVGHDDQFTHATRRMRELVKEGYLGGLPLHMESYYCYDLGDQKYAKSLMGDRNHWVRALPGTLMQNNISHGVCRIAEFMTDDRPVVTAHGFVSPFLRELGETDIIDEARVIISANSCMTAYFTFSTQMRPALRQFRLYGPKNGLLVDHHEQAVIKLRGNLYKSYLEKFIPHYGYAAQYVGNSMGNMRSFLKNDFHMKSGMKYLIESFYREIILTSRIMDSIFEQIDTKREMERSPELLI
jgi:predicted dehydrogenase